MLTAYFHHLFTHMDARLSDTFGMSTTHVDCKHQLRVRVYYNLYFKREISNNYLSFKTERITGYHASCQDTFVYFSVDIKKEAFFCEI